MLHLSYLFSNVCGPHGVDNVIEIGAAAIGAGADPMELMEEVGMNSKVRPRPIVDEPSVIVRGAEFDQEALGSVNPAATIGRADEVRSDT